MATISYNQCLQSMFKLRRFGIKPGLSRIKEILNILKNPQKKFPSIHIAGTNGKGSIASTLANIIQKSGYKVGLYTSPHLINFNERICINGVPISNEFIIKLWQILKSLKLNNKNITFFEYTTAMAFCAFKHKKVDFAIIEAGMGGKFDATNVIKPILSIITNISIEHKEFLGNSLKLICKEKAGIIKTKTVIISSATQKTVTQTINKISRNKKSQFILKGRDYFIKKNKNNTFSYFGKNNYWHNINFNLIGNHQIENAATILASCEILRKKYPIPLKSIRSGFFTAKWAGRLEIISKEPYIILDGAHNLIASKKLGIFFKTNKLLKLIKNYSKVAIAFSGGLDSAVLLILISSVLKKNVLAITAKSNIHFFDDILNAKKISKNLNIKHIYINSKEMFLNNFILNNKDRCFFCKKNIFRKICQISLKNGFNNVLHAANIDDLVDYRPGFKAACEFGIYSPFIEAGFSKKDIRYLAKIYGLEIWKSNAKSCIASRFPYGNFIDFKSVKKIERAECVLFKSGIKLCRVRHYGNIARIELSYNDMRNFFINLYIKKKILKKLKRIGYDHILLNLENYSQGSMNKLLLNKKYFII